MQNLPPEFRAKFLEYHRSAREAANNFARVCKEGRADQIENATLGLDDTLGGWRLAMVRVAKLERVTREVQDAFVTEWIIRKHVPLLVCDRPACAAGLRVLFPGNYSGPPLRVYRGTDESERRRRLYGFSWTRDLAIAQRFAQEHANVGIVGMVGIVLETVAIPEAVLLVREPKGAYDEGEVALDPYRPGKVTVLGRMAPAVSGPLGPESR
jgi:hypothetical protein